MGTPNNDNSLNIVHQNIRSMRRNFDSFVSEISAWPSYPDIIILSEIWVKKEEALFYDIEGFELFLNANENYRAGGIVIFVKRDRVTITGQEIPEIQAADTIRISFKFCKREFNILAVYRLHKFPINLFNTELQNYLSKLEKSKLLTNFMLIGDTNVDILNIENYDVDNFKIIMASFGFESLVNEYTRVTDTTKTCIDNVYVRVISREEVDCEAEVLKTDITDHYMTGVRLWVLRAGGRWRDGGLADCPSSGYDTTRPPHRVAVSTTRGCWICCIPLTGQ